MKKSSNTKRALLASILSLLLCMAMLVGSTFAWFTDTVTSGNNKIVAGNLDVELEYATVDESGVLQDNWTSVADATSLFDKEALWEPGHAEVVYLRVRNAGTLALKYKFSMNILSETTALNVDGKEFNLSAYLKYGVVEEQSSAFEERADAIAAVTEPIALTDYSKEETLLAGAEPMYLALVVYMPETVGNEANYRGETIPSIDLGIELMATQMKYEYDSFGNDYDDLSFDDDGFIKKYNDQGRLTSVIIPEGVTAIANYAFQGASYLTSVVIPDTVTSIGNSAFRNCKALTSIEIPDSVTSIGTYAFSGTSLTSVALPENLTAIASNAFYNCTSLESIDIPDSVTSIGTYAFEGCTSLESVQLPDNLEVLGGRAFFNCSSLKTVDLPDSLTTIGANAFYQTGLTSIAIPASVTSIASSAFSKCADLMTITVAEGNEVYSSVGNCLIQGTTLVAGCNGSDISKAGDITAIEAYAFQGCTALTSANIPETVTTIGRDAFASCTALESVTIPEGVTVIPGGAFYECTSLKNVTMGSSVTKLEQSAFSKCTSLEAIVLPATLTEIGTYAFNACSSLTSVTGGTSVAYIGGCAFMGATNLQTLEVKYGNWKQGYNSKVMGDSAQAAKVVRNNYDTQDLRWSSAL